MLYTVLISASPRLPHLHQDALRHCRRLIEAGDQIKQVFFMHAATQMAVHSEAQQWSDFATEYQLELQTCISTAEQQQLNANEYKQGFLQGGLSSLADSILSSDAVLQIHEDIPLANEEPVLDKKNIAFVFSTAPEQDSIAAQGVDLLLVLSAFDASLSVFFVGEGIQNLYPKESQPRYIKRFKALPDFEVTRCFIVAENEQAFLNASQDASVTCDYLSQSEFVNLTKQSHTLCF